ncbi:MAG: toprim domain-containing protein [Bacteroidota bacterium]
MNSIQAKAIRLDELMARLGYEVKKVERGGQEYKYLSPFRSEKEASFNVNIKKNVWYDFGHTNGSHTLNFAIEYLKSKGRSGSVKEALAWLEEMMGSSHTKKQSHTVQFNPSASPQKEGKIDAATRQLEFVRASPITSKVIFTYLEGRGIVRELAKRYLLRIEYQNKNKPRKRPYFGFGQQNESRGYEIRSASDAPGGKFKSALIQRDITVHKGSEPNNGICSIFEGMLDHLSLLMMLNVYQLRGDSIIMNALSSYDRTKAYIEEKGYTRIELFLDNDDSGQKAIQRFREDFGGMVFDHSSKFLPYKDLNEALQTGFIPDFTHNENPPQP